MECFEDRGRAATDNRTRYNQEAEAWTAAQADRLGVDSEDILEAVRRGWLPENIEGLSVAEAGGMALSYADFLAGKMAEAPVEAVAVSEADKARLEQANRKRIN